jgi:hypothetical protein
MWTWRGPSMAITFSLMATSVALAWAFAQLSAVERAEEALP